MPFLDHLFVDRQFRRDLRRELLGRAADDQCANVGDALSNAGVFQRRSHRRIDLVDHLPWQSPGPVNAVVHHPVDRPEAHFFEGRNLGQLRQAMRRCHHDGDQMTVLDERKRRWEVIENDRHLAGHGIDQRGARTAIGNMRDEGARQTLEQLHLQVRDAARAELLYECFPGCCFNSAMKSL